MVARRPHYRDKKYDAHHIAHLTCKDRAAHGVTALRVLVISPRGRKVPVLTRNSERPGTRVYPWCRRWGTTREGGGSFRGSADRDRERRASEERCSARARARGAERVIAMSAVIYEAVILVCRCRGREGCPLLPFSPFLSHSKSPRDPLTREAKSFVVRNGPPARLRRGATFIGLPHYFTTDSGLRGLSAVVRTIGCPYYRDIKFVRYEDYPFFNEWGRTTRRRLRVSPCEMPI